MTLTKLAFGFILLQISVFQTECRLFKPSTSALLQTAIDSAQPGDTIQLAAIDYEGDFVASHSGNKNQEIKIIGTQHEDGSTATQIVGNITAIHIRADYWFVKDLNVSALEEGIVIEGDHNHLESLAVLEATQAVSILGNENTLGSLSISNVNDGIVVQGNDNVFRDIAWSNASTGIIVERGDRNKLHNLAVHNNIKDGVSLLLETGTCCGKLTNVVLDGLVDIKGSNYYFRQTIAYQVVNIHGCNNTFGRSIFGRTYITKECNQIMRSSNVYQYPQTKPLLLKDV